MDAVNPEVVQVLSLISTSLKNTEASKAIKSKMDRTVLVEAQGDIAPLDISKTREFPEVLSDKMLGKENLRQDLKSMNHPTIWTLLP